MLTEKRRTVRQRPSTSPRTARLDPGPHQLELDDARVRQLWRRVNEEAARQDQRAAEDAHDQGTLLNEIAALTLDRTSDEVAAHFLLGADAARERMAVARTTSRLMAGFYGLERIRLGLRLLAHYGLARLEQLETMDLPVQDADGTPVRFPATREGLERAVRTLEKP